MNFKMAALVILVFGIGIIVWSYPRSIEVFLACEKPIAYNVGTFDRKFGISYQTFLSALTEAEAIWEKPIGKELFVYSPENSELAVNLVYDYRQETTGTLSNLENVVAKNETAYQILRTKYLDLKEKYNNTKNIYDARVETLNEKNAVYQKQVESWNKGQRTSRKQFDQLEAQRTALEREILELKSLEAQLNELVGEINPLVETLNNLARSLNLNVETYNTIGASRGETFVGGIYHSDERAQEINVYEFSSRDKLVRVLAHEFGHALGLEHVDDSEAIMYRLNESEAGILSKTELVKLQTLCGIK